MLVTNKDKFPLVEDGLWLEMNNYEKGKQPYTTGVWLRFGEAKTIDTMINYVGPPAVPLHWIIVVPEYLVSLSAIVNFDVDIILYYLYDTIRIDNAIDSGELPKYSKQDYNRLLIANLINHFGEKEIRLFYNNYPRFTHNEEDHIVDITTMKEAIDDYFRWVSEDPSHVGYEGADDSLTKRLLMLVQIEHGVPTILATDTGRSSYEMDDPIFSHLVK